MVHQQRRLNLYHSIKRAVTSKWNVLLSSDGYANYGAVDQLTSDGYGLGGFGNPGAWCVLGKTINTDTYYFCLQNDGYMGLRLKYSKIGFNSGTDTLLQVPSATDEQVLLGGGTDIAPTYQQVISGVLNFNVRSAVILLQTTTNKINITLTPPLLPAPNPVANPTIPVINKVLT